GRIDRSPVRRQCQSLRRRTYAVFAGAGWLCACRPRQVDEEWVAASRAFGFRRRHTHRHRDGKIDAFLGVSLHHRRIFVWRDAGVVDRARGARIISSENQSQRTGGAADACSRGRNTLDHRIRRHCRCDCFHLVGTAIAHHHRQRRALPADPHRGLPPFPQTPAPHYNFCMTDPLLRYRPEFPILERTTYMISNSLGAMPRAVYDAMHDYADIWANRGVRAWEEKWWMLAAEVGEQLGELMNAPKASVALFQNVTTCQAVVASCLDFSGRRNKVLYTDMNFPSVMYFWEAQRAYGARVHMVPTDDGITIPTERLLKAIDEETLVVPVSHVIFRSAYINDAKAIIDRAHRVGAYVVLDTFQSLGTVPVDVCDLDVDFACGGVLKWLCGGPGVISKHRHT